jgi:hypothetical protein
VPRALLVAADHKSVHAVVDYRDHVSVRRGDQSMIPKKPAPDLIRGGYRFSAKIMLHQ